LLAGIEPAPDVIGNISAVPEKLSCKDEVA
jgi:hypothetical protein